MPLLQSQIGYIERMTEQTPDALLQLWLQRQLSEDAKKWLSDALVTLEADSSDRTFFKLFGFVPRKIGKDDLRLSAFDLTAAEAARGGWDPRGWSTDQAGRLLLLLRSRSNPQELFERTEQLYVTADVGELVVLYRGLPLFPEPSLYAKRGPEGIRTNIKSAFEAVAHCNPFPREQFDESEWNQMVLKALFIDCTLWPIQGLDERANPTLARMLVDYAHERWAAHREVSPELWRCVGPHADSQAIEDLGKVLGGDDEKRRQAAALALATCSAAQAQQLVDARRDLAAAARGGEISWEDLAQ